MAIDEDQTSPVSLIKWPFYASAVFILGFVLFFALNRPPDQPLDQWQLATCVLASALASILLFLPFLLQKFLELALSPSALSRRARARGGANHHPAESMLGTL